MTSPWQVLGLQPGSSLQEIRQAYARLLKQHRPDVDPEGFRRIRDAYEQLRASGAPRQRGADPAPRRQASAPAPTPRSAVERRSPSPGPRRRASRPSFARRLRRALARAGPEERARRRVLQVLVGAWRRGDGHGGATLRLLLEELADQRATVRTLLRPTDAMLAVERGAAALPACLVRAHVRASDLAALRPLLATLEDAARSPDPQQVQVWLQLAPEVAVYEPRAAERMADLAFRARADGGVGDFGDLDERIQVGKEILRLPAEERLLFARVLATDLEADDPDIARAAARLVKLRGAAPLLASMFVGRFPAHAERLAEAKRPRRVRTPREPRRLWPLWLVILAIGMVAKIVRSCSEFWSTPARHEPPWQRWHSDRR